MHVDGAYNWFRRANPHFKIVLGQAQSLVFSGRRVRTSMICVGMTVPFVREAVAGLRLLKNALIRR